MDFLDNAVRFQRHLQWVISNYFSVSYDSEYLFNFHEREAGIYLSHTFSQSYRQPSSPDQIFISSMNFILGPTLDAIKYEQDLCKLQPKMRIFRASDSLMNVVKYLAFESYHFVERLKSLGDAAVAISSSNYFSEFLSSTMSSIIKKFKNENSEWLRYRNFVVHSPNNHADPFRDLVSTEICAITLHDDVWFEFNNIFDELKELWMSRAKILLSSICSCLISIQHMNEKVISEFGYSFVPDPKGTKDTT